MSVNYRWHLYGVDGTRLGLYETPATQPHNVEWGRSLSRMDSCRLRVPRGHDMESHIDPQEPQGFIRMEREVVGQVARRTEWVGVIRAADSDDTPESEGTAYTARSLEWLLRSRSILWNAETPGRTQWTHATIVSIVTDLIRYNLGPDATTAQGRWADGRLAWPALTVQTTGTDILESYATADDTMLSYLDDLAGFGDDVFLIEWVREGQIRLRFGTRPIGIDRTQIGSDYLLVSRRWDQVERLQQRTDLASTPTVVAVRHQQDVTDLPSAQATPATQHTLQALTGHTGLAYEQIVTQSSDDIPASVEARGLLDAGQRAAANADVELNLTKVIYGRDFELGDRIAVEVGDTIVAAEVEAISGKYTLRRGEILDVRFSLPRGGLYG